MKSLNGNHIICGGTKIGAKNGTNDDTQKKQCSQRAQKKN